jgi:hypothetical protein
MRTSSIVTLLFLGLISTSEAIKIQGQENENEVISGKDENKALVALG